MNLKQLSENLGLSQTTVSRALNGYPEVNETTRRRVQQAAAEGNYRPNQTAMSLATGKAMAIGHVIPVATKNDVVNPVFAEFVAGASQTYNLHGYELMLTIAESKDEESIYKSLAAKRAVDGVIVHSPLRNDPRLALLNEIGLPFVVHGRVSDSTADYNWIDMNNRRAFKQATQLLIDLGHRKIALINGQETLNFAWLRRLGYEEAFKENKMEVDLRLLSSAALTEPYGYQKAMALLAADNPPSAFLVSSYIVALGVRRAISQSGLTIGKDVSVIIHDDELSYFDNGGAVPQFTSTRSSVREAGIIAAEMLLKQINDPNLYPQSQLLESHLTIGSSTGPYKA
ncbi:UNVERIFIED_CONTAM: hypothetical protein GTU68_065619 [Idotea baltica]|nr:hypothetical protein [Idotea baltica]